MSRPVRSTIGRRQSIHFCTYRRIQFHGIHKFSNCGNLRIPTVEGGAVGAGSCWRPARSGSGGSTGSGSELAVPMLNGFVEGWCIDVSIDDLGTSLLPTRCPRHFTNFCKLAIRKRNRRMRCPCRRRKWRQTLLMSMLHLHSQYSARTLSQCVAVQL